MSDASSLRLHAIYVALDELALFRASLESVYDHVDRITVITSHDRDWRREQRDPSAITAEILGRDLDPDRKIDLIVTSETNEARARNRAMDYAAPSPASNRVRRQHDRDHALQAPDYFLIVDADEVYEAGDLERMKGYVAAGRRPLYRVACRRYFKRWNYRIDGFEWLMAFVRVDQRLPYLRMRKASFARRALSRIPGLPATARGGLLGYHDIPAAIGVFHHGTYVGPRSRIEAKLESFGHRDEIAEHWLEAVYDSWTVASRDFNPAYPESFARARRVDGAALPIEITRQRWPPEYLDD
jgi:hypothetical protein